MKGVGGGHSALKVIPLLQMFVILALQPTNSSKRVKSFVPKLPVRPHLMRPQTAITKRNSDHMSKHINRHMTNRKLTNTSAWNMTRCPLLQLFCTRNKDLDVAMVEDYQVEKTHNNENVSSILNRLN